jgi:hypothetical protein
MPYYSDNGGLIGFGKISQPRGVYDVDFSRLNPPILFTASSIAGFAAYMTSFRSEIKNPSFYNYNLDGGEFAISDGGGDMYDSGNNTFPWYTANSPVYSNLSGVSNNIGLSYAITPSGIIDTDMVYASTGWTSFGTTQPLSMIGVRSTANRSIGFQKSGNSGADGAGILDSGVFYNAATILGFTVYAFRRQTYNAGDPSHCDLYMLIGHSAWGSVYGTINSFADPVSNGGSGGHFYMTNATNVIAITSLLSKSSGVLVTQAELETIVQAWVNRLKLYYAL